MNNHTLKRVLALGALLIPLMASGAEEPLKDPTIRLFLQICAATYAHTPEVAQVAEEAGLDELPGREAIRFLAGHPGRAWRGAIDARTYAVAVEPNGLCSVFAFTGDAAKLQAAVEASLPPASTGIVVQREDLTMRPDLKSTSYELRGGKVQERWVVTIATDPAAPLRAILSWNRLEGNHSPESK